MSANSYVGDTELRLTRKRQLDELEMELRQRRSIFIPDDLLDAQGLILIAKRLNARKDRQLLLQAVRAWAETMGRRP